MHRAVQREHPVQEEIDTVVGELKRIVERLRGMSPAYKAFLDGEKE